MSYLKGTGGGPYIPPPAPQNDEEKELAKTIALSIQGLSNNYDSDGVAGTRGISLSEIDNNNDQILIEHVDIDWTKPHAKLLQTEIHPALRVNTELEEDCENESTDQDYLINDHQYYQLVDREIPSSSLGTSDINEKSNITFNKENENPKKKYPSGEGSTLTMDEIVAQCFVFFLAGFETSSTTVTFALFELSLNLEIQDKVREELMRVLKKYDNKMCYDALKDLVYMQQVIDETLRKYPPLPFVTRECVLDYKIPDANVILEKGTNVIIPIKNIHYDENIYEEPEKFDPERFSAEQIQNRHQYAHIPFGEGPRICIGMRFGLMQSKVALATILSNFHVKLSSKTKTPLEMDAKSFVTSTKGGVWLDLEKI